MTATDRRVREAFIELTDTLVTDFDIIAPRSACCAGRPVTITSS